ncbi:amino acid ABC transporter ATP-binding protein, partial [Aerococcus urinae]|nr:amino acid ABC transporter ATP-binding protein [Aerococcus urinae]
TMVVVTHEMSFAKNVADHIIFMEQGEVIEEGDPYSFFNAQKNQRVHKFLNVLDRF